MAANDDFAATSVVEATAGQFFDQLMTTFDGAARRYSSSFDVLLATKRIRLRFATPLLAEQLAPALRHIEVPASGEPDLQICAWDGELPGESPTAPWRAGDVGAQGVIEGFNDARFHVAFNAHSLALSAADLAARRAFFWTPRTSSLAAYEKAAPFRTILSWFVQAWGGQLAHASAVVAEDQCALVVGPSGSGKSTVALACWMSGLGYLSDDYCALLPDADGIVVATTYATAKLDRRHLGLAYPELAAREQPDWAAGHEKAILPLDGDLRQRPASARLAVILAPTIVSRPESELCACSGAAALAALAPSSIFQTPRLGPKAFRFYAGLVARFPCRRLLLGARLHEIPERVRQALARRR